MQPEFKELARNGIVEVEVGSLVGGKAKSRLGGNNFLLERVRPFKTTNNRAATICNWDPTLPPRKLVGRRTRFGGTEEA